jgi:hypothetical protein
MDRHRLLGFEGCLKAIPDSVRALAELLKATEAAVLEEAANEVVFHAYAKDFAIWARNQAKERKQEI